MQTKIYNKDGEQIFAVHVYIVCPVEHIMVARHIAADHVTHHEKAIDGRPGEMLAVPYSFTGQQPATHYVCSRRVNTDMQDAMVATIARQPFDWCAKEFNPPAGVTDKFCVRNSLGRLKKIG
jgi:hypothetical protein